METQTDYKQSHNYETSTNYNRDNKVITCVNQYGQVITINTAKLVIT